MSKKLIASRQKDLDQAANYAEWQEIATELDRLEGADAWKQDEMSDDYDYLLIKERLNTLRELRKSGEVRQRQHCWHLRDGDGDLHLRADTARHVAHCQHDADRVALGAAAV
eukprot:gene67688-92711_t